MANLTFEKALKEKGFELVGGVDEAGRGPLAGPVVAAAVILKSSAFNTRIDDSKLLSPRQREKAYLEITQAGFVGLGVVGEDIIDTHNILIATNMAMQKAIFSCVSSLKNKLKDKTKLYFLVDGANMRLDIPYAFRCITKGDSKSLSIAAASIIAKVSRDRMMEAYDKTYPLYGFKKHKGYPTKEHILNLRKFGASRLHRKTFFPVSEVINK